VITGPAVTFAALLMLKVPQTQAAFNTINRAVKAIADATRAGTSFVFGYVGGGPLPFDPKSSGSDFILAFQALPVVLVMSVLSSLLFYWRIMPRIVRGFSWALERTLDVGAAVGLSTAANIFVGQVEAPLFIRPYLPQLSRSEMFVVMTGGMAGIAGTVFVLYATILANAIPNAAGHIAVCSVLGAPAAIFISLIMVPDPKQKHTGGTLGQSGAEGADKVEQIANSTMDAIVKGTGRRPRAPSQYHGDADRLCRAGASGQRDAWPVAGRSGSAADAAARARLGDGAGLLADGDSMVTSRHRRRGSRPFSMSSSPIWSLPPYLTCSTRCAASPISVRSAS